MNHLKPRTLDHPQTAPTRASSFSWRHSPLLLSLLSGTCLWLSFPPVGWSWCAWLAPVPWLRLVQRPDVSVPKFYAKIWLGAVVHWLVMLQGVRLAHPANYVGWLALSCYVAAYVPVFVALARRAIHVQHVPLVWAAPVLWTVLEWTRGYLLTGFSLALFGHSQYQQVWLIQIADLTGAYGVSFVMMATGAGVAEFWDRRKEPRSRLSSDSWPIGYRWRPLLAAAVLLALVALYGAWRRVSPRPSAGSSLRVALLQGTRDKVFEFNPESEQKGFQQYWGLMQEARDQSQPLDLIVWPESAFTELLPDAILRGTPPPPSDSGFSAEEFHTRLQKLQAAFAAKVVSAAESANRLWRNGEFQTGRTALILGVESVDAGPDGVWQRNTALWCDPAGQIRGRYFKMHPVMFGEYIPFARTFPVIYRWTPMRQGLEPGDGARQFEIAGYRLAPSVCFESTVPQVMRGHVRDLSRAGTPPDVLINLSDDGWFWGSSILDLQLACGVFRAVELRRPFLVAANTGLTVQIDGDGRIVQQLPRRRAGYLIANVARDGRYSGYAEWGDWFPAACGLAWGGWLAIPWLRRRWASRRLPPAPRPR